MGRHGDDHSARSTWPLPIGSPGLHSDEPLDLDRPRRSRWRIVLLWVLIVIAVLTLLPVTLGMINTGSEVGTVVNTPAVKINETPQEIFPETVTKTVEVPAPVVTRVIRVPGPVTTRTVRPSPTPVPGPTVTVKVKVPGPTVTKIVETPGPEKTVTKCYTVAMIEIPCPSDE